MITNDNKGGEFHTTSTFNGFRNTVDVNDSFFEFIFYFFTFSSIVFSSWFTAFTVTMRTSISAWSSFFFRSFSGWSFCFCFFWSSNFSLGVTVFRAVNRYLARIMNRFPDYTPSLSETHHVHKLDYPSGTAITLAEELIAEADALDGWYVGEAQLADGTVVTGDPTGPEQLRIEVFRRDEVPGIHSIAWESEADTITITHDAHSRKGFALGAVLAAEYTATHEGLLTMSDLFKF